MWKDKFYDSHTNEFNPNTVFGQLLLLGNQEADLLSEEVKKTLHLLLVSLEILYAKHNEML
jgi:hypothetical protein